MTYTQSLSLLCRKQVLQAQRVFWYHDLFWIVNGKMWPVRDIEEVIILN